MQGTCHTSARGYSIPPSSFSGQNWDPNVLRDPIRSWSELVTSCDTQMCGAVVSEFMPLLGVPGPTLSEDGSVPSTALLTTMQLRLRGGPGYIRITHEILVQLSGLGRLTYHLRLALAVVMAITVEPSRGYLLPRRASIERSIATVHFPRQWYKIHTFMTLQ